MGAFFSKPSARILGTIVAHSAFAGVVFNACAAYQRSANTHAAYINITRNDYEQALAKWKAQNIQEYEIITYTQAFMGGQTKLHVSDFGNKIDQLDPAVRPFNTLAKEDVESLKRYSIEGMFAEIDAAQKRGPDSQSEYVHTTYEVRFDQHLGYPSYWEVLTNFDDGDRRVTVYCS